MDGKDVESHERLASLETSMSHVLDRLVEITKDVESIKSVVWKAVGGATIALALMQFLLKGH